MDILADAIIKKDFQKITELLHNPNIYVRCLFDIAYYNDIDMFKLVINYDPNIIKSKFKHNDVTLTIVSFCIVNDKYEILKILLDLGVDKYEDKTILLKTFYLKLDANIIKLLLTESSAYQSIIEDSVSLSHLIHCCSDQLDNLDVILSHNEILREKIVYSLCLTKNHVVLEKILKRLQHLFFLDGVLSKPIILVSASSVEIAKVCEQYFEIEDYTHLRFFCAFLCADVSVIEYMINECNCPLPFLDQLVQRITSENEKKYLDKFAFLISKGATVNNIDGVKSLQLRRILTNNKEYVTISEVKQQCYCCYEDMNIGDTIVKLPCKHQFHEDCFNLWKVNCPTCRWE